jgi:flagellar basal body-associated protein FliL
VDEAAEKMGPIYDYRNQLAKQVKGETGTSQDYLIWIAVGIVAVLFIAAAAVILIGIRKGP